MLYDISPPLTEALKVWPGDTPLTRQVLSDMRAGDNLTLSTLHTTVHVGAHADAPSHYGKTAPSIEKRCLDYYLGPCQVIRVEAPRGTGIGPEALTSHVAADRVLIATGTFPDPTEFNEDFAALTEEFINWLHDHGVKLVGVDTPSIDPFHSKDLPAHNACLRHDMAILEGLVLADVPEGMYELIALPLKLMGFDASPVRAVLRALE